MVAVMQLPMPTSVDDDVVIDRDTLLTACIRLANNGEALFGVWFATMVGNPNYDLCPLRLPRTLAKRLGLC